MTYERRGNATLAPTSATPAGFAGGDLAGTYPNPTVPGLATKAGVLTPTAVKTTAYTAAAGDLVPCDTTAGAFTVTLPSAPADKSVVAVKHVIQGATNTVTVACGGTNVFNKTGGSTSGTLTLLNQALLLQYKATGGIWYVVSDDLSLAQLDLRYLGIFTAIPESQVTGLVTDLAAKVGIGSTSWLIAELANVAYNSVTRDSNEAVTAATVTWPDGSGGTYTSDTVSTAFPGFVDAYHVTYAPGGTVTHTVTQAAVTRDASGNITAQPTVTVS